MNVSLPVVLEEFVRRKVDAGEFSSPDEVVCEALRLLQNQGAWRADARRKIDEGWEEARAGMLRPPEKVRKSLDSRKKNWKPPHYIPAHK
jgi:putative addiction module CopG family antidote